MSWISSNQESRHPSLPTRGARGFFAGLIVFSLGMVACGGGDDAEPTQAAASTTSQPASPGASASASPTKPGTTPNASSTAAVSVTAVASVTAGATEAPSSTATTAAVATATATSPGTQPTATTPPPPPTATSVPPTATTKPPPAPVSIALTDGPARFSFSPSNVTVPAGTTVTWIWGGAAFHDVTGPGFGSTTKESGTYSFTFATPGTYNYTCTVHSSSQPPMTGRIVVE